MSEIKARLGDQEFDRYRSDGEHTQFLAARVSEMGRDDLLAVIGWMAESNRFWRDYVTADRKRRNR